MKIPELLKKKPEPPNTKPASWLGLEAEWRALDARICGLREEFSALNAQRSAPSSELRVLELQTVMEPVHVEYGRKNYSSYNKTLQIRTDRMEELKRTIADLNKRCDAINKQLEPLVAKARDIRHEINAGRSTFAREAVEAAVAQSAELAPGEEGLSRKAVLDIEAEKLARLQVEKSAIDLEVHRLSTTPLDEEPALAQTRVDHYLEHGTWPADWPSNAKRQDELRLAMRNQKDIDKAVTIQTRAVRTARDRYAGRVQKHIRPTLEFAVQEIVGGMEKTRTAISLYQDLVNHFEAVTQNSEILAAIGLPPGMTPPGYQVDGSGAILAIDAFSFYMERLRSCGFQV